MKKLVTILITILVLCSPANGAKKGKKLETQGKIFIGQSKYQFCFLEELTTVWSGAYCNRFLDYYDNDKLTPVPGKYFQIEGFEVIGLVKENRYYVFSDVKAHLGEYSPDPFLKSSTTRKIGDGKLAAIFNSLEDAKNYVKKEFAKMNEIKQKEKKKITEKPKEKVKPKIDINDNKIVPAGSGSGFFVLKDGTVITNYHVIEGCELNKVSYKGSQSEAKVLSIDKVNDIAILKTNIKPLTAFAVSNEDVSLLEDVVVAGYPLGKQISSAIKTHKGVVTALAGAGDNYSYFQTDAAINQGNSGGPIINQKGNVVGIAVQTWIEEGVQGVHFGIKSSTLKTFANANGLKFLAPNNRDLSNKELGKLITESTVYVECHMTIAQIKKMIAQSENKKALYDKYR